MTQEIKNKNIRYCRINALMKKLADQLEPLKRDIIAYHDGRDSVVEDGFTSLISHKSRESFIKESLKNHFGGTIPVEYIKTTQFDSLSVKHS